MTDKILNWSRTVESQAAVVMQPKTEQQVLEILGDAERYPAPVVAMGHFHSTTKCAAVENGTVIDMTAMDQVIEITRDTVTAQAGAMYLDVSKRLADKGLNFYVNLQIGNVTLGSLAACDSKDGSYPGQYGQIGAYVTRIKLATVAGDILVIDESQPDLLQAVRSSYGLLGIVLEVTFRIKPLEPISIEHKSYSFELFIEALPDLRKRDGSMMVYLFPFANNVIAQLRGPGDPKRWRNVWLWWLRNIGVAYGVSLFSRFVDFVRISTLRYLLQQTFFALCRFILVYLLRAKNTRPNQQTTNYPAHPRFACFTFSIFAFPAEEYPTILLAYRDFCWRYYNSTSYRPDLLTVGYQVAQCDYSLFSYSSQGEVMTIDPVATGVDGWKDFVVAFNEFAHRWNGKPLFNQTPGLKHKQVVAAYGDRIEVFKRYRDQFDPDRRLCNQYFAEILG